MKKILISLHALFLVLWLITGHTARADEIELPASSDISAEYDETLFTPDELDDLLAPIALYPDPLIAQILPAASFIDQIDEAARYVRPYGKSARIEDKPWDVSVKAIAHYPDVLFMMDRKYDWTVSLGQAFINQQQDVMDAIQRLRARAISAGSLISSPQQQVVVEEDIIRIVPAEPEVIYVPQYDPQVVYVESLYPSYGYIDFGIGFTIGAWLNRDCDWHNRRVFYHGWRGDGWIRRSRPHIPIRNNVYINQTYGNININRRVIRHDTGRYREELRRNRRIHRQQGVPVVPGGREMRPRERIENRNVPQTLPAPVAPPPQSQPAGVIRIPPRPATGATQQPGNKDIYRGREGNSGRSSSTNPGYGGYGSSKEAETFRERGRTSRGIMRQLKHQPSTPASIITPGPAIRSPDTGGRRQSPSPALQQPPPAMRQAPPAGRQAPGTSAPVRRGNRERR